MRKTIAWIGLVAATVVLAGCTNDTESRIVAPGPLGEQASVPSVTAYATAP